jgi:hypothetical protein
MVISIVIRLAANRDHIHNRLSQRGLCILRMGRDSNPRYLAVHTLSRRAQSTTLAPIRNEPQILMPQRLCFNLLFKGLIEGIKLRFELSLALLNNLQPQLMPVKLDCRVMNMPFDFVHLSLCLA